MYDIDAVQELLDVRTEERDLLRKEINKWIFTTSVIQRQRDTYKAIFSRLAECVAEALQEVHKKINLKKT